jgi:hypothetical protein
MLGAELEKGEQLLKKTGFRTKVVPLYSEPREHIDGVEYSHITGRYQAVCDFTGETVQAADFDFISPWEIRSDHAFRGFLEYLARSMESDLMAAFTIAKDWSYWLTSKAHATDLRSRFGLTSDL